MNNEIVQCNSNGYSARTLQNIRETDVTMAFAIYPNTAGEIATKKHCLKLNKPYLMSLIGKSFDIKVAFLFLNEHKPVRLNVAGNGIYTLKVPQEVVDKFIFNTFLVLKNKGALETVKVIQSGGQTGVDESAIKAAMKLGIATKIVAPKYWTFRNENGQDISDEILFKKRFEV